VSDSYTAWFEKEESSVVVCIDRVAISLSLDEFLEFYDSITEIKDDLLSDEEICLGTYEEDGKLKRQLIFIPESEDLN
tara:strand:+ start:2313 stop:2546 length:234 start_codon:yes stop_codon:yes gene_type:complete